MEASYKLLEYILKGLVSNPEKIDILQEKEEDLTIFTIELAEEDKGIVIGKAGKTIRAIRNLLSICEQQNVLLRVN